MSIFGSISSYQIIVELNMLCNNYQPISLSLSGHIKFVATPFFPPSKYSQRCKAFYEACKYSSLLIYPYLLQLCTGIDEKSVGSSFQLVFAPIDDFPDETPLISSGFRVIPLDMKTVKCCQIPNYIIHYPFDCSLGPYVLYLLLH